MAECEICGEHRAVYKCRLCGRLVCPLHFNRKKGICSVCEMALCEICGKNLSIGYCPICGRLGCSDCLVQITPVVRVCKDCIARYGVNGVKRILGIE